MNEDDVCLAECATMHTIFRDERYVLKLILTKANLNTIFDTINLVNGSRRVNMIPPNKTKFHINDTLYSNKSKNKNKKLPSFKNIHRNEYYIKTIKVDNIEYYYTTSFIYSK